jgi:hypothetical protein
MITPQSVLVTPIAAALSRVTIAKLRKEYDEPFGSLGMPSSNTSIALGCTLQR